jgi:hypothetical protein
MKEADALLADQILQRVQGALVPTQADAARNFAGIEARLGLAGSGVPPARADAAAGPGGPGLGAGSSFASRAGANAALAGARGVRLALQLGVLVSFGLATGVVGYVLGRGTAEQQRAESPPALVQAASAPLGARSESGALPADPAVATLSTAAGTETVPAENVEGERVEALPRRGRERPAPRALLQRSVSAPVKQTPHGLELSEALELLRNAEAAVRRSEGLEARMWLGDLDRRAPREMLREERLATLVLASCALGDGAAARAALLELEQQNPESMYRARLEGSCAAPAP